jgi:hypothetical protein
MRQAENYNKIGMTALAWKQEPMTFKSSIPCQSRLTCAPFGRRALQMVARAPTSTKASTRVIATHIIQTSMRRGIRSK